MAQTIDYDIVGSFNSQRIVSIDAERSVNLFEYIDPLGKKPKSLLTTSGLINTDIDFLTASEGFRAQFVFNNFEYGVIGDRIYRKDTAGIISILNNSTPLTTTAGYVGVDANTFQVIFVDGQHGYIWDDTAQDFHQITDPAFPAQPIDICYLDGFFNVPQGGTNNFQLSMFNEGLVWGPDYSSGTGNAFLATSGASPNLVLTSASTLHYQVGTPIVFNGGGTLPSGTPSISIGTTYYVVSVVNATTFTISTTLGGTPITFASTGSGSIFVTNNGQLQQASVTSHPGTITACRTLHRRLFLFSQNFTEVWENAGIGTNLPFRRNNSLLMEFGTVAIGSVSVGFDKMFFLSNSRDGLGAVQQVDGTEAIPISTRAIDFIFAGYATDGFVSDCRSFLIKENGIIFYRMNFTLANHTWVYDVTFSNPTNDSTKLWHEEEVLNGNRHPAQTHAYFNGINYVGHYSSPIEYQVDNGTYTNDGEAIRRMRITRPFVPPGYQRIRVDRLQVDLLQGQVDQFIYVSNELSLLAESGLTIDTESGIALILDQSSSDLVSTDTMFMFLSISKDGGQTYGYTLRAPLGQIGQRTFRTLWRKLGATKRGQAFVAKFEFYEAIPLSILGACWAMDVLPE